MRTPSPNPKRNPSSRGLFHLHTAARNLYGPRFELGEILRGELPMPLKASFGSVATRRSSAMAGVILAHALAQSAAEVHILCGINHASEIAWFIAR